MKKWTYIFGIFFVLITWGCNDDVEQWETESPSIEIPSEVPEGYFVVTFNQSARTPVSGSDTRVQSLLYILYKSTGEYVKERVILVPGGATPSWPLPVVRDTLPLGKYRAVFMGNADKTLFPYKVTGGGGATALSDILVNYQSTYSNARLNLPNVEFADNTEYYWANDTFSQKTPNPPVLLQRILGKLNVHRNVVDAQQALNQLVQNIVTQMGYKNVIRNTAKTILTDKVKTALGPAGILLLPLGGITAATDTIVGRLLNPVVDTLYNHLLKELVNQISVALTGNSDQATLLEKLGSLLNPWEFSQANTAIVTIKDFPKSIDFNLVVKELYTGKKRFACKFSTDQYFKQKTINIKGFSGLYNIQEINVIKEGLISGLLVDQVIDNTLLLDGTFVDIRDSLRNNTATNIQYKADYSLVDIGLKSYDPQTGTSPLSLTVRLGNVTNITQLLTGLPGIGDLLALVLTPLNNITVTVPVNLPLLAVSNLTISGKWSVPAAYQ
ncbi:hypothetical protein [Gabonibacter chumensis]|uniref:hypothetical protein n=1 Tax=Gabonibacter chumensis TaxID=2972474 RepID=UPI002572DC00|nr:hypothetical protein [Gabonibacter chumensis]MCR9011216.1 hypothetical protein [Gabonibacter chumensis]